MTLIEMLEGGVQKLSDAINGNQQDDDAPFSNVELNSSQTSGDRAARLFTAFKQYASIAGVEKSGYISMVASFSSPQVRGKYTDGMVGADPFWYDMEQVILYSGRKEILCITKTDVDIKTHTYKRQYDAEINSFLNALEAKIPHLRPKTVQKPLEFR